MESRFEYVSALEGVRQLVAELSNAEHQRQSRGVLFFVYSGKRIRLLNPNTDPPRSALIRLHGDSTLGYTTASPYGDPTQDYSVEVVRDYDQRLHSEIMAFYRRVSSQ